MTIFLKANLYTYSEYRAKVSADLKFNLENPTADNEEITNYTNLSVARMNRLDKTLRVSDAILARLNELDKKYVFYVISEGWCGDASQILPAINKLCEASDLLEMKIIFRDENLEIMDKYLTNGSRSIPKLIICDATGNELAIWGPRPKAATDLVIDLKNAYGGITTEVKEGLQKWYNNNRGIDVQNEILDLLK